MLIDFPSITVEGVKIPKVLIGINSLLGWSHTSSGRDRWLRKYYTSERIADVFIRSMELGVYGVLGPVWPTLVEAIKIAEEKTGRRMIFVSTTIGDLEETENELDAIEDLNSPVCCIHGLWTDAWPVKDKKLVGFEKYLNMIRERGKVPGVACHNGEILRLVDGGNYDVAVYVTPVNKLGYFMFPTQQSILDFVRDTKKPVIAIKPLSCGRFMEGEIPEWLRWCVDQKGVSSLCIGFMNKDEAEEDILYMMDLLGLGKETSRVKEVNWLEGTINVPLEDIINSCQMNIIKILRKHGYKIDS